MKNYFIHILKMRFTARLKVQLQRIVNYIGAVFLSIACLFASFLAFQNGEADLKDLDVYEGILIDKGRTTAKTSVAGKGKLTTTVYFIKIEGLNQILATYNPQSSYNDIDRELNLGDNIKVFYKYSTASNAPNLETFQIEKGDKIILGREGYQFRERAVGYIAFLAGFLILGLQIKHDRKYWRKKNTNFCQ